MSKRVLFAFLALTSVTLAGCADGGGNGDPQSNPEEAPHVEATATTGGIRGVVVDDRIAPIKGVRVEVVGTDKNMTTGEDGLFALSGLEAGAYTVRASHPLFASSQQTAQVTPGETEPKAVKIQLIRTVFETPFYQTLQYDGFIVCSINVVILLSEECGEGVGIDCAVPVIGCTRQGGQANNNVQFDFTVGPGAKSLTIEKHWEPTSEAGAALYSPIATEWSCLPVCQGNRIGEIDGTSPLHTYIGNATLEEAEILPDETVISVFTWASPSYTGAVLNQKYTDFVTVFYYVPAPEDWSFVAGHGSPF